MLRPHGYTIGTDPRTGKTVCETDTIQCAHCQAHYNIGVGQSATDIGGFCPKCSQFICGPCADRMVCDPWERQMERSESREALLRAVGV